MKKFKRTVALGICIVIAASLLTAFSSNAKSMFVGEVGNINAPVASPVLDGVIDASDNWSFPANLNINNLISYWNTSACPTVTADIYFAYDDEGLYFAANVFDSRDIVYSTTEKTETKTQGVYKGYNGDAVILCLDALSGHTYASFLNADYTAWYGVYIGEGDTLKVYRTRTLNNGDITEDVEGAVKTTDIGWSFEIKLPWEMIAADAKETSFNLVNPNKEELTEVGAVSRAMVSIMDRYEDPETGVPSTSYFSTACTRRYDGKHATELVGDIIHCYGIKITNAGDSFATTPFADVPSGAWYEKAVARTVEKGYINGTSADTFTPDGNLTRGMYATLLGRLAGVSKYAYIPASFSDVSADMYYAPYIEWAARNGIVKGVGDGLFAPDKAITRAEMAAMLYNYTVYQNSYYAAQLNPEGFYVDMLPDFSATAADGFTDSADIPVWAKEALAWAVSNGLFSGFPGGTISPNDLSSRAQVAVLFTAFSDNYMNSAFAALSESMQNII